MVCLALSGSLFAQNGLYGLASGGGKFNVGTIFRVDTSGTFDVRHDLFRFDGSNPRSELFEASNGRLYGTASFGGTDGFGVLFSYDPVNEIYKKVHDMTSSTGSRPYGSLIEPVAGVLYGMTSIGGANGKGTIFSFNINTNTYTVEHNFDGTNGEEPWGGLTLHNGKLYGMTRYGGLFNQGVLFEFDHNTGTLTKLVDQDAIRGMFPLGDLLVYGNSLIGTTLSGGAFNGGMIFQFDLGTATHTNLQDLDNTTGRLPFCGLAQASNGLFYGLTSSGGNNLGGTFYSYDIDSDTLIVIRHLSITDGRAPLGKVIQSSSGVLYGMTQLGGTFGVGTMFSYNITTSTFSVLKNFNGSDGSRPWSGVMEASNGFIYALTEQGGDNNSGVLAEFDDDFLTWTVKVHLNTSDGANPKGSLMITTSGRMFGLTSIGGLFNLGAIFEYAPDTDEFELLHSFDQLEGALPFGSLVEASNGKLYGLTSAGGADGIGVLFSYDPNTSTFLKQVDMVSSTGAAPTGSMIEASNGALYGTTQSGGSGGNGVVFKYEPGTNTYTKILNLGSAIGKKPEGDLVEASNGTLYGLTRFGGADTVGVIYELDPSTDTYTDVFSFSTPLGSEPTGNLIEGVDGLLYGMTQEGGAFFSGTIFSWDPATSTHTVIYDFDEPNGEFPNGSLFEMPNGTMFGTTISGGLHDEGVLFKIWPGTGTYTILRDLTGLDGIFPFGNLVYYESPTISLNIKAFLSGHMILLVP